MSDRPRRDSDCLLCLRTPCVCPPLLFGQAIEMPFDVLKLGLHTSRPPDHAPWPMRRWRMTVEIPDAGNDLLQPFINEAMGRYMDACRNGMMGRLPCESLTFAYEAKLVTVVCEASQFSPTYQSTTLPDGARIDAHELGAAITARNAVLDNERTKALLERKPQFKGKVTVTRAETAHGTFDPPLTVVWPHRQMGKSDQLRYIGVDLAKPGADRTVTAEEAARLAGHSKPDVADAMAMMAMTMQAVREQTGMTEDLRRRLEDDEVEECGDILAAALDGLDVAQAEADAALKAYRAALRDRRWRRVRAWFERRWLQP